MIQCIKRYVKKSIPKIDTFKKVLTQNPKLPQEKTTCGNLFANTQKVIFGRKIANEYDKDGFSVFSLDSYRSKNKSNDKVYVREKISKISIMLILAFINMYLMVSSNILKKKEIFRILRMLGLEKKKKYSIVVLENLIVAFIILLLSSMISIFIYYTESSTLNQLYMDIYSKELFEFRMPYLEMFIFALVTIISSMAAIYVCKDMKEIQNKMN